MKQRIVARVSMTYPCVTCPIRRLFLDLSTCPYTICPRTSFSVSQGFPSQPNRRKSRASEEDLYSSSPQIEQLVAFLIGWIATEYSVWPRPIFCCMLMACKWGR